MTLSEIGHLQDIVEQYAYYDRGIGAHRRLSDQIQDKALEQGAGPLTYDFGYWYRFEQADPPETWPHGRGVVNGVFSGRVIETGVSLLIRGEFSFTFTDVFTDPTDVRGWLLEDHDAPPIGYSI